MKKNILLKNSFSDFICFKNKSSAFTLAEVLITLGIIGIVAALTIPNLMGKYRQHVVENRLKKFYSASNQAIQLSEVKNGPKEYWPFCIGGATNYEQWYDIYLKNFLNTTHVEHFINAGGSNTVSYFEDGSVMVIKDCYDIYFYPYAKDFDKDKFMKVSEDGVAHRPDCGKKFFAFSFRPALNRDSSVLHIGKGIEPYRALICKTITNEDGSKERVCNNLTRDELINNSEYGCNETSPYKVYCTALIQDNGWKIPKDYPFKF